MNFQLKKFSNTSVLLIYHLELQIKGILKSKNENFFHKAIINGLPRENQ